MIKIDELKIASMIKMLDGNNNGNEVKQILQEALEKLSMEELKVFCDKLKTVKNKYKVELIFLSTKLIEMKNECSKGEQATKEMLQLITELFIHSSFLEDDVRDHIGDLIENADYDEMMKAIEKRAGHVSEEEMFAQYALNTIRKDKLDIGKFTKCLINRLSPVDFAKILVAFEDYKEELDLALKIDGLDSESLGDLLKGLKKEDKDLLRKTNARMNAQARKGRLPNKEDLPPHLQKELSELLDNNLDRKTGALVINENNISKELLDILMEHSMSL